MCHEIYISIYLNIYIDTDIDTHISTYSLLLPHSGGYSHTLAGFPTASFHLRTSASLLPQPGMLLEHVACALTSSGLLLPWHHPGERPSLELQLPLPVSAFPYPSLLEVLGKYSSS